MKKKRRVFDIDFDAGVVQEPTVAPSPAPDTDDGEQRRGPMAAAITENAGALDARADAEAAIRAENDALAHEFVRLKKLGLITDLISIDQIKTTKLQRDRIVTDPDWLDDLKVSVQAIGLSNPILVEKHDDGYELIQGMRRYATFRDLAQTDPKYSKIPATMVPKGETLDTLYRKMVDENLIRQDISFAEMARLSIGYASDQGVDISTAIERLFASAGRQKRAYIRNFARLFSVHDLRLKFEKAMPRALGLSLYKACEEDPAMADRLNAALLSRPADTPEDEMAMLRAELSQKDARTPDPKSVSNPSQSKTTLRVSHPSGDVKCLASSGRLVVQQERDFSAVNKARLERALTAFFEALEGD